MSQETNKRIVLAGLLIVVGIALLLRNFGWVEFIPAYVFEWPMIFVLIGTFILLSRKAVFPALIFIGIGLYFLLPDIFGFYIDRFWMLWPLILIAVGMSLLLRDRSPKHDHWSRKGERSADIDYIDELSVFGGGEKLITSQEFKGGRITNIFGGSEINMLNANLSKGTNYIDILTIFGGSTLIVPSHWNVKVDMISIFGGFGDKRDFHQESNDKSEPELYIKGLTLFGGGEIKSHK